MEEINASQELEVQRGSSKAKYLQMKPPQLNSAGYKVDDQYYSVENSTVDDAECTYNVGKYKQAISGNFGTSGSFIIPNSSFAGNVYLTLRLDLTGRTNLSLPRGWGYAAIASVQYQMGSSNANQVQINGQSVFHTVMQQCCTVSARSTRLRLAGEEVNDGPYGVIEATMLIPLPWSTASGDGKLPLDTEMMSSQIFINVALNNVESFIGGNGAKPNAFSRAELTLRQGELTYKDVSLAPLSKNMGLTYAYPFSNTQSYVYSATSGATADNTINVALTGLTNGDLTCMVLSVMKTALLTSSAGSSVSPFAPDRIRDVNIAFGGNIILGAPGESWRCFQMDSKYDASFYQNSILDPTGTTAPFLSSPFDSEPIVVIFSRRPTIQNDYHVPNVKSYPNNTLTMSFLPPVGTPAATQYTVFATYYYTAALDFSHGSTTLLM